MSALDDALNAIDQAFRIGSVVVHENVVKDFYTIQAGEYQIDEVIDRHHKMTPLLANHLYAIGKADLMMASGLRKNCPKFNGNDRARIYGVK